MASKPEYERYHSRPKSPKGRRAKSKSSRKNYTNIEREGNPTIFGIRENLVKNINDSHMENLQEIQSNFKQKRMQSDLDRYPATDGEKFEHTSYYLSQGALTTPYKEDRDGSVNQSINSINGYDIDPKLKKKGNTDRRKSENGKVDPESRLKARITNDESLKNISDDVGDDEPEFPIIVRKGKVVDQETYEGFEEPSGFVYQNHNYNHMNLKKKEGSNFPFAGQKKGEDLRIKKRNSNYEERFTTDEIERFERYVGIRPKKLALNFNNQLTNNTKDKDFGRSISQPQSRRMNDNSARANNYNTGRQGFLPRLNIKELNPGTLRTNTNMTNKYISTPKKTVLEPLYISHSTQKQRPPSSLNRTNPVGRSPNTSIRHLDESNVVNNVSMREDYEIKKTSRVSNLLKHITKDQTSALRPSMGQKRNNSSYANDETSLSRSDRSKNSSRHTLPTSLKIPSFKNNDDPIVTSNRLMRSLYRVKNGSGAFSARSEENVDRHANSRSGSPLLENASVDKAVQADLGRDNSKDKKENRSQNKFLSQLNLNLNNKVKSAGIQNNRHSSITSIHRQVSNMNTSSRVVSLGQDSVLGFSTKRNRSLIEKFNKEWEDRKKKIERGMRKEASFIQFQTQGNPIIPRSKGISFEKALKMSLFSGTAKTPGPGKYQIATPTKGAAFSFRTEKKFDITGLSLIEDVNKMMDVTRHVNNA